MTGPVRCTITALMILLVGGCATGKVATAPETPSPAVPSPAHNH